MQLLGKYKFQKKLQKGIDPNVNWQNAQWGIMQHYVSRSKLDHPQDVSCDNANIAQWLAERVNNYQNALSDHFKKLSSKN